MSFNSAIVASILPLLVLSSPSRDEDALKLSHHSEFPIQYVVIFYMLMKLSRSRRLQRRPSLTSRRRITDSRTRRTEQDSTRKESSSSSSKRDSRAITSGKKSQKVIQKQSQRPAPKQNLILLRRRSLTFTTPRPSQSVRRRSIAYVLDKQSQKLRLPKMKKSSARRLIKDAA